MNELEKQLQELAMKDWQTFKTIIGEDNILHAKICLYRQKDKSLTEISIKLNISRGTARYHCEKCETKD